MPNASRMISLEQLNFLGGGLNRPECVLAHESGRLFVSDCEGHGGVSILHPSGAVERIQARDAPRPLHPNGIALEPGGTFLLADLGTEEGGVWRLAPSGEVEPVLLDVEGRALPPTNYVHRDAQDRIWIAISTRLVPRHLAYRHDTADGFLVLMDSRGARIVADKLGYTNECVVSPDGGHLYVNETFARRLSRFAIGAGGALGSRETVATFGAGTFPDGLTFDAEGGLWVTSIVSNRVIRVAPDGAQQVMLEDCDDAHLAWVEQAYLAGEMGRPHLDGVKSRRLRSISSLAFGGPDLRTAYLGCLLGDAIASFRSPVPGAPPAHWNHRVD